MPRSFCFSEVVTLRTGEILPEEFLPISVLRLLTLGRRITGLLFALFVLGFAR
jgi:hypothetical protein